MRMIGGTVQECDDIVARLRAWAKGAEEQGVDEVFAGLNAAADEIERLRRQMCQMSDERIEMLTAHGKIVKTLIAERDGLRRQLDQFVGDFKNEVQMEAI